MPLITDFKKALEKAIDRFSQKEGKLTEVQAQIILEIKQLIGKAEDVVFLRQEILAKLPHIPSKPLYFLPFVNDLGKEIRKVIYHHQFDEHQLILSGYCDLRTENNQLREENNLLKAEFESFKVSGLGKETTSIIKNLQRENERLTDELSLNKQQYQQQIEFLTNENSTLEQNILWWTREKEAMKLELEKTIIEKRELSENLLKKIDENLKLKEENKFLKEELEKYRKNNFIKQDNANYHAKFSL